MKGGDLLGPLTLCHSSTKVTPGGGNEGEGRSGTEGGKDPFFVCRIALLARSLSLYHLTLPYQHQATLLILRLFCAVAPLFILSSLTFVWQASTQKMTAPPSFPPPNNFFPPQCLPFYPCTFFSNSTPLYLIYFPFLRFLSFKMVAVDERSCALSVDLDTSRSLGLLSYMHFTSAGLYLCRTSVTDTVTMATVSKDH